MSKRYRKLKTLFFINLFWSLDYMYVVRKQLFGLVSRTKPERYRNPVTLLPSIILIPGIYEPWQFMKPVAALLRRHGYDVHVIEDLGYNHRDIEDMAKVIDTYIKTTNIKTFVLIAHSKGGLIGKYLLASHNDDKKIKGMIALNTPFSGSLYAYLFPLVKPLRVFMPTSSILKFLSRNQLVNESIVSIYGTFDPHIPGGSRLEGAKNIQLDTHGHFRIMKDRKVHQAILKEIERFTK